MVAVQVTDEDVVNLVVAEVVFLQLQLAAFSAVNEKMMVAYVEVLGGWKPAVGRKCAAGAEDGKLE